jgi:hypothetical protein
VLPERSAERTTRRPLPKKQDSFGKFRRWVERSFPPLFGIAWFGSLGVLVLAVFIGPPALFLRHVASAVLSLLIIVWLAVSGTALLWALRRSRSPRPGSPFTLASAYQVALHLTGAVFIGGALGLLCVLVLSLVG